MSNILHTEFKNNLSNNDKKAVTEAITEVSGNTNTNTARTYIREAKYMEELRRIKILADYFTHGDLNLLCEKVFESQASEIDV